ncbi:MAG: hypothetical protein GXY55_06575 [Phycisphaerae bacterium]|nr:hypothetical protein [Phycisphaerae bacterium]
MIKTIHLFWSRWLTGQVMQANSVTGESYTLGIYRLDPDTDKVEPIMLVDGRELYDIRVLVDSALSLIEHMLDGGSHTAWCDRRGYVWPQTPSSPPRSAAEIVAEALQPSGQES